MINILIEQMFAQIRDNSYHCLPFATEERVQFHVPIYASSKVTM
jgi:hypothetical protein